MKKTLLIALISSSVSLSFGQAQIGNGDFESFGTAFGGEPTNWNSFLSASGTWSGVASDQIAESPDVRPGTTGTKSCRIFSKSTLGIVANGNVTLGKINMGSTTPANASNYNASITNDPDFSEALTDQPDSIVFWAKFTPNGGSGNARMKAVLHDSYDYRDPQDGASATHVVATAVENYPSTGGNWVRFSVPFVYTGPAAVNTFILVTFTTNETPGGGDANDEVLIDDVELIYNPTSGINEVNNDGIIVSMDNAKNYIKITSANELKGDYTVFNNLGQDIQSGSISSEVEFNGKPGVYFIHLNANNKAYSFEFLKN